MTREQASESVREFLKFEDATSIGWAFAVEYEDITDDQIEKIVDRFLENLNGATEYETDDVYRACWDVLGGSGEFF